MRKEAVPEGAKRMSERKRQVYLRSVFRGIGISRDAYNRFLDDENRLNWMLRKYGLDRELLDIQIWGTR